MVSDANKGITGIVYNHLNLPTGISINGSVGNGGISYIYDETGTKLRKKVVETGKPDRYTYYAGNYVYEGSSLKYFGQPEGYVDAENGFGYVYQYRDHLGNIRLSYKDVSLTSTPSLQIVEENNYYPFGLQHKGYNNVISHTEYNWDYQGKENQKEHGLDWHDFGARNYDVALGRWLSLDALSEEFPDWSPYNAMLNNPINFIDPDGQLALEINELERPPTKFVNEKGETIADTNDGNYQTYVVKEENMGAFVKELKGNVETKDDLKAEKNKELGGKYGYDIKDIEKNGNASREYPTSGGTMGDFGFFSGYQTGYGSDKSQPGMDLILGMDSGDFSGGSTTGSKVGARHKAQGKMNMFDPVLKDTPANNSIKVNKADPKPNSYKYSDKPIPLIIEN